MLLHSQHQSKVRLINFRYLPDPVDRRLWWSDPTDEFAGEFWKLVESSLLGDPELHMPGAWVA